MRAQKRPPYLIAENSDIRVSDSRYEACQVETFVEVFVLDGMRLGYLRRRKTLEKTELLFSQINALPEVSDTITYKIQII